MDSTSHAWRITEQEDGFGPEMDPVMPHGFRAR